MGLQATPCSPAESPFVASPPIWPKGLVQISNSRYRAFFPIPFDSLEEAASPSKSILLFSISSYILTTAPPSVCLGHSRNSQNAIE
jgi:hypothetical protein